MNSLFRRVLFCCSLSSALMAALTATAQSNPIFGLVSTTITPPSGVATPTSVLTIQLGGVAGSTLVPQNISVVPQSPGIFEISLTNPGTAGAAVPTGWNMQTMHGPLPAGVYDFYVRGVIGFGTPNEMILGKEQVIDNFLVIPEPAAGMLAAMAMIGLPMGRRRW